MALVSARACDVSGCGVVPADGTCFLCGRDICKQHVGCRIDAGLLFVVPNDNASCASAAQSIDNRTKFACPPEMLLLCVPCELQVGREVMSIEVVSVKEHFTAALEAFTEAVRVAWSIRVLQDKPTLPPGQRMVAKSTVHSGGMVTVAPYTAAPVSPVWGSTIPDDLPDDE